MSRVAHAVAQAKINLGLRVLARDATGYHALETVFHRLELADMVRVRRTDGERTLSVDGPALPAGGLGPNEENLAWRAAAAYAEAAGWRGGFAIEIVKQIPVGGGLGGGSADAGAVLRACDRLSDSPLGPSVLMELAGRLGSDVPFLTAETPAAMAWGRGDRMLPLPALPQRKVALVIPRFPVSTVSAYGWLAESRGGAAPEPGSHGADRYADWSGFTDAANDFEPVVGARHPEIPELVQLLKKTGAQPAMLSGSGSTVFGVFTEEVPDRLARALAARPDAPALIVTRTAARVVPVAVTG